MAIMGDTEELQVVPKLEHNQLPPDKTMVITEDMEEVVLKLERSLHRMDRIMEVMDLLEVVPKQDHNRPVELGVPEAARKLGHNLSTRANRPLDPEENIQKFTSRAMGLAFESALMNQLMEPKRRPKVRLGFGKAEKRMTK